MILCGLNVTVLCPCLHQLPDLQVLQQKGEDLDTKQGLMLSTTLSSNGMMPLPRKRDWIHVWYLPNVLVWVPERNAPINKCLHIWHIFKVTCTSYKIFFLKKVLWYLPIKLCLRTLKKIWKNNQKKKKVNILPNDTLNEWSNSLFIWGYYITCVYIQYFIYESLWNSHRI